MATFPCKTAGELFFFLLQNLRLPCATNGPWDAMMASAVKTVKSRKQLNQHHANEHVKHRVSRQRFTNFNHAYSCRPGRKRSKEMTCASWGITFTTQFFGTGDDLRWLPVALFPWMRNNMQVYLHH